MSDNPWQAIESAPYEIGVEIKVEGGTVLNAELRRDASLSEDEEPCDQWVAAEGADYPACWSAGACWQSNEDGNMSLQPIAWRHAQEPS